MYSKLSLRDLDKKMTSAGSENRTKEKTEQTAYVYVKTTRELFGVRHGSENKNKIKLASG